MTSVSIARPYAPATNWQTLAPWITTGLAFLFLFQEPAATLARDWWTDPDAGHGLLLFPVAIFLAWQRGFTRSAPQRVVGALILLAAVALRYLSGLAAELFTMRLSMVGALCGLIVYTRGMGQLRHWWLPLTLVTLSVPIPAVVLGSLALPLQLKASRMGAALLASRHVPVAQSGNIIQLPTMSLFVAEACSGLRSLTALLALGTLAGGLWLRGPSARLALIAVAVPIAMILNGIRIFLVGFLVYYVDPRLADGFLHATEGWAMFVIAFAALAVVARGIRELELMLRLGDARA